MTHSQRRTSGSARRPSIVHTPLFPARLVRIGEADGRAALLVDGTVQSISPHDGASRGGYWAAMLPMDRPRRSLILGLGGGTLARLLLERWGPDARVVGVDDDAEVLATARGAGWLDAPGLDVVQEDAFAYVERCPERFDFVALDLYRGPHMVGQALNKPFLRRLRSLLEPPGWLAVNLFRDGLAPRRVERIGRVFRIERQVLVGDNLIVHARVPRG